MHTTGRHRQSDKSTQGARDPPLPFNPNEAAPKYGIDPASGGLWKVGDTVAGLSVLMQPLLGLAAPAVLPPAAGGRARVDAGQCRWFHSGRVAVGRKLDGTVVAIGAVAFAIAGVAVPPAAVAHVRQAPHVVTVTEVAVPGACAPVPLVGARAVADLLLAHPIDTVWHDPARPGRAIGSAGRRWVCIGCHATFDALRGLAEHVGAPPGGFERVSTVNTRAPQPPAGRYTPPGFTGAGPDRATLARSLAELGRRLYLRKAASTRRGVWTWHGRNGYSKR